MEAHLKPQRFDTVPGSPQAAQEWNHWYRTFVNFLTATKAETDEDKYRILINFISSTVYSYISEHNDFNSAIAALRDTYDKRPNTMYARHLLASAKQQSHQSLDDYLRTLRTLALDCDYKPVTAEQYRSECIRDAFIAGISSNFIRQRLLESEILSLEQAFTLARTLDLAQKNADSYHSHSNYMASSVVVETDLSERASVVHGDISVAAVKSKSRITSPAKSSNKCWFCGESRHPRKDCPAKNANCRKCGKVGHWAKVCNSSSESASTLVTPFVPSGYPRLAVASSVNSAYSHVVLETISVDGQQTEGLLDSGATDNFIDEKFVYKNKFTVFPANFSVGLASNSCSSKARGVCYVNLVVQNQKYENTRVSILKDLVKPIILGESFMKQHSSVIFNFGGPKPSLVVSALAPMDADLPPMFANLDNSVRPLAVKSRRYSTEDKTFIKQEIQRLLADDVIEPSKSPWRAQVLVDRKEGKKPRLCIDYSRTINRYTVPDSYPLPNADDMVYEVAKYSRYTTYDLKTAYHLAKLSKSDIPYTAFEADGKLYQFKRLPFGLTNAVAAFQRLMDELVEEYHLEGVFVYIDNITIVGETQEQHDINVRKFLEAAKVKNLTFNEGKTISNTDTITLLGYEISKGNLRPDPDRVKPLLEMPIPNSLKALKRVIGMFAYYARWIPNYSDTIRPLLQSNSIPLGSDAINSFQTLLKLLANAALQGIDENLPFTVETDASNHCLSATLNQGGRPVAFHSRTLSNSELHQSAVEKEAHAIVDAVRKWYYLLASKHFTLVTDQRSVSYLFNKDHANAIKNSKLMRWRLELAPLNYTVVYRPGKQNYAADTLTRASCGAIISDEELHKIHDTLCHPGITRTLHFIRARNLPYSAEDVKRVIAKCTVCSEVKPRFYKPENCPLVQAARPMQRLNIDFKGPIPSCTRNKYMLTIVDEYSRYPFAIPCPDMLGSTVISSLTQVFTLFGMPDFVHSDRGTNFLSTEVTSYLHSLGVATSKTTPYNPRGNGQCERFNGIIWQTIELALKSRDLPISKWELVLCEALHSIRSLLCTATNSSPHDRIFSYSRKSAAGVALPDWLSTPGATILMKRHQRNSKYEPLTDRVELVNCNPQYAQVRLPNGRETSVSLRDLAPLGDSLPAAGDVNIENTDDVTDVPAELSGDVEVHSEGGMLKPAVVVSEPRRSPQISKPPDWLQYK